jgi:polysaccharide biosynthesis protein PelE
LRPFRDIAVLATIVCEGAAGVALMRGFGIPALLVHVAASGWTAVLFQRAFEDRTRVGFALIFATAFLVPFLGTLGLVAVAALTPRATTVPERDCVPTRIPRPPEIVDPPSLSVGHRQPGERQARIEALTTLRGRSDPGAIAALRDAMEDRDEDVRLLAHALLEAKNRAASREIDAANGALDRAPQRQLGSLHRRLASQYWEVAWLGLAQGECLDHALGTARRHAMAALEQDPRSASLHFLLGRIELRLGAPERAERALLRSRDLGLPASIAAPYLAEAAFLRRRFDLVRSHLALPARATPGGAVARVRRYWT